MVRFQNEYQMSESIFRFEIYILFGTNGMEWNEMKCTYFEIHHESLIIMKTS